MKVLQTAILLGLLGAPAPLLAAPTGSADIEAKGSAPTFCNISNDGGVVSMSISPEGDSLIGDGKFSYVANGNSKVVLSAVSQTSPERAAPSSPRIELADLVANSSGSSSADSKESGGVIRKVGAITASIKQNNAARLLTAGDYALQATATCTSL
ncbi:hypothetical protein KBZ14_06775 [Synechococcus sp. HJ21-Hayes]|uniref:hypothetical protein n=1 Tax=unclassified Synechococcus TaxID=2626047 RepID=UPI0020CDF970|nr:MULTISPECIES: hypothetical protein [unclassified Synechococcus]MCP9852570.1 hypothetical protein [Synechococcus sp. HJ21-Hayes]